MLILGLAAPLSSGKTILASRLMRRTLQKELIISSCFSTSDRIAEIASLMGDAAPDRFAKHDIAQMIAKRHGGDFGIVNALYPTVAKSQVNLAIIDSIRSEAQILRWIELMPGNFRLLYIEVSEQRRWELFLARSKKEISYEEFLSEHAESTDNNLERLKSFADFTISNEGTLKELDDQIDCLIKELACIIKASP
jgi:dephospho-CoA kinase